MKRILTALLLLQSCPAAARMEDRTEELYKAVAAGDLKAVKAILEDSDQDVNVAWDENDTSPLMLACGAGHEELARLLIEKGADIAAVDAAGKPVEEYLLPADKPVKKRLRRLIHETAAEKNIRLPYAWLTILTPDPASSPAVSAAPQVLPAANAADGKKDTAWASRGTGAELWLFINPGAPSIRILNGYGKTPGLFKANNRVRKLAVSVWTAEHLDGDVTETSRAWKAARLTPDSVLELRDEGGPQEFPLPAGWEELRFKRAEAASALMKRTDHRGRKRLYSSFVLRFEPLEVYRGDKYNDTCVSEISAGGRWLNEAALPGVWERPYGGDKETVSLSTPQERLYSLRRGGKTLQSGNWRVEDGSLVMEHEAGTVRYAAFVETSGGGRSLRMTGEGGETLIYRPAR
ncbi:MAG: ankyrin repeat domain-containing protein [Elusimicrobiota bacterium]